MAAELTGRARRKHPLRGRLADLFLRRSRKLSGLRATAAARRAEYGREPRRRTVPVALLSDGTDVETLLPAPPPDDRTLTGMGASGQVTGRARVVHDPSDATLDPGGILVAPTTDPGRTPLFLTADGLLLPLSPGTHTGWVLRLGAEPPGVHGRARGPTSC
ncbi:hypothetical protein A6E92_00610 [Streptomyces sp. S8]|uniref:hypothetical protein n=1 Tax=Streptomyces sp. S8 TaxID=1837283 RepID=UPI000A093800|nr:hypothetical protein [Streptomyces sp. S8]ARI50802.1 hypothetical protein A6E92_00610 [Streptomyces sp. S8]